ncbi:NFATC2-interacting protein isoform X2 [Ascaphus truei]|uniref:NFATC2-interacting protein isoform X2 n=1 Tax=Ascaphus truei TaxID=8439 RepID=UPI003F59D396
MAERSDESSDSDVEIVTPRERCVKRRRILAGTLPANVSVYSNKVNSSLKLLPDDPTALSQMAEQMSRVQGPEDLESDGVGVQLRNRQKPHVYNLTDSEEEEGNEEERSGIPQCEKVRDASPSPPPTPQTPKMNKGRAYRQIREMDAQLKDLGTVLSPSHRSVTEDDVILVASSPAPELTVKVRRRGELFRINLRTSDPLQKLAESVASRLNVDSSQILLMLRDEELKPTQTPQSLNLTVADIVDCVVLSASDEQGVEDQGSATIRLQVQGKEKRSHLSVTVGKTEPLQSLMDQYHAAMGTTKRKVSFIFEGKKLKGKSTAEELGLESDDVIEVWV